MPQLRRADEHVPSTPILHGAYVCIRPADDGGPESRPRIAEVLTTLESEFGLVNEFTATDQLPAVAYLRRVAATAGTLDDPAVLTADVVVHVAAEHADVVATYASRLTARLEHHATVRTLTGSWLPFEFTGPAMFNFSYARRVLQQPGEVAPNAFLLPISKTPDWWAKSWMERHTYLLPRYDGHGAMVAEGHVLAAAQGVDHLLRRTYRQQSGQAPAGEYDFLTYFECHDDSVSVFLDVVAALRDTKRNPEWAFVNEGPLWHGRRQRSPMDLLANHERGVLS